MLCTSFFVENRMIPLKFLLTKLIDTREISLFLKIVI